MTCDIKLWDTAKIDYSDRFVEGLDGDATISELLERIGTLEERVEEGASSLWISRRILLTTV